MRVFADESFKFRVAPPQPVVVTARLLQLLLEASELALEPRHLLRQAFDGALLLVRVGRPVDSLCSQSLLKEANEGCRSLEVSLIDLVSSWHRLTSRGGIARGNGL